MNLEKEIFDISLQDIIPNRFQPREIFNDNELKELSESIKQHGVIQPIIVRKVGDKYEIIAGERRFRASQLAGKETIPALVRDIDDKEAAKIALLENLQRSNLTPIEEAKTYQTILKIDNITQEELAGNLGKSQSAIANKLRLLTLNEEVQTALLNSQISERHARSLIGLTDAQQLELLHKTINEKLTVRQLDEEIIKITGKNPSSYSEIEETENPYGGEMNMNNELGFNDENNTQTESILTNSEVLNTTIPNKSTPETQQLPNIDQTPIAPVEPISQPEVQPDLNSIFPKVELNNSETPNEEQAPEEKIELSQIELPTIEKPESPIIDTKVEEIPNNTPQNNINKEQTSTILPPEGNIFDKLRVSREEPTQENKFDLKTPDLSTVINSETAPQQTTDFNNIYDLRFAINNFRQAVQNTEKFGFKVNVNENDLGDKYQITIEIDKK